MRLLLALILASPISAQFANSTIANGTFFTGTPPNTITLVQQNIGDGSTCIATSGTSVTCALPSNTAAGHLLVLQWGANPVAATIMGVSGLCSGSWNSAVATNFNRSVAIFYCSSSTSGSNSLTITASNACSGSGCSANLSEWSGITGTVDQTNHQASTSANPLTGTVTTTSANELLIGMTRDANAGTLVSGPTNSFIAMNSPGVTTDGVEFAYRIVSAIGTYSTDWTLAGSAIWDAAIASFK